MSIDLPIYDRLGQKVSDSEKRHSCTHMLNFNKQTKKTFIKLIYLDQCRKMYQLQLNFQHYF
jgi:hypothetical protein